MAKVKQIDGKYWYQETPDTKSYEIGEQEFRMRQLALDTSAGEAFLISAGERMANFANKLSGVDIQRPPPGYMEALNEEHGMATTTGTMAPYLATAPLQRLAGIPAAIGIGAAEGYGFSAPDNEFGDAVLGGLGSGLGNMAGRVLAKIAPSIFSIKMPEPVYKKPALTTKQLQTGKQGFWDKTLANTLGGKGPAQLFGRQNQERMNQLVTEAMGLDASQITKVDGAMLPALKSKISAELTDLESYSKRLRGATNPSKESLAQVNKLYNDALGRAKVIDLALKSVDKNGNINAGKWLDADRLWEKQLSSHYSSTDRIKAVNYVEDASKRATELTDPKLGAFTHATGKSEEVIADVGRTAFLPHTGIPSLLNFVPNWTPVGKGSQLGGTLGGMSHAGLLGRRDN